MRKLLILISTIIISTAFFSVSSSGQWLATDAKYNELRNGPENGTNWQYEALAIAS